MMLRNLTASLLLALAAGCGGDANAPSAEQNRDLDEASEMLDEAPNSLEQVEAEAAEAPTEDAANEQ